MDLLDTASLATIFSNLSWSEVLNARVCCRQWKEAAAVTPVKEIIVEKEAIARDLTWVSQAIPNTQSFKLRGTEDFEIEDGQDAARFPRFSNLQPAPVSLAPIANFTDLKHLALRQTSLNGRYPYLFEFQHLQTLDLLWNTNLKWDLSDLSNMPCLKYLRCVQNHSLTGDLKSVSLLKHSLVELSLFHCANVTGSLEDLYEFRHLQIIELDGTKVTGDIRTIRGHDLLALKQFSVGDGVYGGGSIKTIADAPSVMYARYLLKMRIPGVFKRRRWSLCSDSEERYTIRGHHSRAPPFYVEFVEAGERHGWRWTNCVCGGSCETQWFGPEPDPSHESYATYLKELEESIRRDVNFYRGFLKPPTEEEYYVLADERPLDNPTAKYSSRSCWGEW